MFLDEELLEICKDRVSNDKFDITLLTIDLYDKCHDYVKSKINDNTPDKVLAVTLDRTFNMFDSFVRLAEKDDNEYIRAVGGTMKEFTFKDSFLKNEKLNSIYKSLKSKY